mgnify:CR=1 FL=1
MEIRLLADGYRDNEQLYFDFIHDQIHESKEYFSNETVNIKEAPDFPIYMGRGSKEVVERNFFEAFRIISESYLQEDQDLIMYGNFWHSLLVTYKRDYILEKYPQVKNSYREFKNIVLKHFDWENYIYKCVLASQYITDNVNSEEERERYYKLIVNNLDLFNYIIKYPVFRNDKFLLNILDIVDELGISEFAKAKIKGREDLGDDERYGRRVIFELNKSYPVVMAPMLSKEELKKYFIIYLNYYADVTKLIPKEKLPKELLVSNEMEIEQSEEMVYANVGTGEEMPSSVAEDFADDKKKNKLHKLFKLWQ